MAAFSLGDFVHRSDMSLEFSIVSSILDLKDRFLFDISVSKYPFLTLTQQESVRDTCNSVVSSLAPSSGLIHMINTLTAFPNL